MLTGMLGSDRSIDILEEFMAIEEPGEQAFYAGLEAVSNTVGTLGNILNYLL